MFQTMNIFNRHSTQMAVRNLCALQQRCQHKALPGMQMRLKTTDQCFAGSIAASKRMPMAGSRMPQTSKLRMWFSVKRSLGCLYVVHAAAGQLQRMRQAVELLFLEGSIWHDAADQELPAGHHANKGLRVPSGMAKQDEGKRRAGERHRASWTFLAREASKLLAAVFWAPAGCPTWFAQYMKSTCETPSSAATERCSGRCFRALLMAGLSAKFFLIQVPICTAAQE